MQSRPISPRRSTSTIIHHKVSGNIEIDIKCCQSSTSGARSTPAEVVEVVTMSQKYPFDKDLSDWCCLSSDLVLYGLRIENVRVNSGRIYMPDTPDSRNDNLRWHIRLNVASRILDLLFEYLHNQPRTNLEDISFQMLVELTEAAEDYQVQSAIDSCKYALRKHIPKHPLKILEIAGKYGYHEELIQVAPYVVDEDLSVINSVVPPNLHMPLCIYREQFQSTHRFALEAYPSHRCRFWNEIILNILEELRGHPGDILARVEVIFRDMIQQVMQRDGVNACCIDPLNIWCQKVIARKNEQVSLRIPMLTP